MLPNNLGKCSRPCFCLFVSTENELVQEKLPEWWKLASPTTEKVVVLRAVDSLELIGMPFWLSLSSPLEEIKSKFLVH